MVLGIRLLLNLYRLCMLTTCGRLELASVPRLEMETRLTIGDPSLRRLGEGEEEPSEAG